MISAVQPGPCNRSVGRFCQATVQLVNRPSLRTFNVTSNHHANIPTLALLKPPAYFALSASLFVTTGLQERLVPTIHNSLDLGGVQNNCLLHCRSGGHPALSIHILGMSPKLAKKKNAGPFEWENKFGGLQFWEIPIFQDPTLQNHNNFKTSWN